MEEKKPNLEIIGGDAPVAVDHKRQEQESQDDVIRRKVFTQMVERQIYPVKLIQGATIIDLIAEENTGATRKRPFMVFEVAVPDRTVQSAIYKVRVEDDPKQQARCEIAFYRDLVDTLQAHMPLELAQRIRLPKLYLSDDGGDLPCLMIEQFEGKVCGGIHEVDPGVMQDQDLMDLTRFIKFFQEFAHKTYENKELPTAVPRLMAMERYKYLVEKWGGAIKETLGDEYYHKLIRVKSNFSH